MLIQGRHATRRRSLPRDAIPCLNTAAMSSAIRLTSFPCIFLYLSSPYLEICRTKTCVWKLLLTQSLALPLAQLQQLTSLQHRSLTWHPPGTCAAAPAKYLFCFTRAQEHLAKADNWDHFTPLKIHTKKNSYSKCFIKLKKTSNLFNLEFLTPPTLMRSDVIYKCSCALVWSSIKPASTVSWHWLHKAGRNLKQRTLNMYLNQKSISWCWVSWRSG